MQFVVCSNKNGACNVFGSLECANCGSSCKIGYEGDRCQTCQSWFYVSNGVINGEVNSTTGVGPICKGLNFKAIEHTSNKWYLLNAFSL